MKQAHFAQRRPVDEYTLTGEYVRTWVSLTAAGKSVGLHYGTIRKVCVGLAVTAGNRVWRYKNEPFDAYPTPDIPELYPDEYFVHIPGTCAEVSNYGRVRSEINYGKLYKVTEDGAVYITVYGYKEKRKAYILEAENMLPNPHRRHRVGFKDGNKKNCKLDNLMWL